MMSDGTDIRVIRDGPAWLTVGIDLPGIAADRVILWFTEPDKLLRWWGQEADIQPRPGGRYEVRWPSMSWTMRGEIAALSEHELIYSWHWLHEPDLPARVVIVHADAEEGGATVRVTHGPYRQSEAFPREDEDRQSHRDGWTTFLPALRAAIAAS